MKEHANVPLPDFRELAPDDMRSAAADFLARMQTRHTVRDFSDRPVAREIIETCIQAAGLAPSGANQQPWHFAVISSPEIKQRVRIAAEAEEKAFYESKSSEEWLSHLAPLGTDAAKPFLETAPWLIAIFAQKKGGIAEDGRTKNYYVTESVGIAAGFLIAALHQAGLATLTHTPAPMGFLNEICARPAFEKPFLLLVAGYPAQDAMIQRHAQIKKPLAQIASWL